MEEEQQWNSRTLLLIGAERAARLSGSHVLVAGVGGVGGYVVEMLVRSGVGRLTLVDSDRVSTSNLNRQLIALRGTVGSVKTELFAKRVPEINAECEVTAIQQFVTPENACETLSAAKYDFVADCIDTVGAKVALLAECYRQRVKVISSMGAGGRIDPTRVRYADLWETRQDGLARAVRDGFKRKGIKPKIPVVYSDEAPMRSSLLREQGREGKRTGYGTLATIPSLFGIYMGSYIIRKLIGL